MRLGRGLGLGQYRGAGGWSPLSLNPEIWLRPEELNNPNLLALTSALSLANGWFVSNITRTLSQTDPDGGTEAVLLEPTGSVGNENLEKDAEAYVQGAAHTLSYWIKAGPGHDGTSLAVAQIYDGVGSTNGTGVVPSATWQRITVTRTLEGAATRLRARLFPDNTTGTQQVYATWPQVELGSSATDYVGSGATPGGLVTLWPDQSANGNDATQSVTASKPLVQLAALDGLAGALDDGVDDQLDLDTALVNVWRYAVFNGAYSKDVAQQSYSIVGGDGFVHNEWIVTTSEITGDDLTNLEAYLQGRFPSATGF